MVCYPVPREEIQAASERGDPIDHVWRKRVRIPGYIWVQSNLTRECLILDEASNFTHDANHINNEQRNAIQGH